MQGWNHLSKDLTFRPQPRLPEYLKTKPRMRLADLPTPLQELKRLSSELGGPQIFIKRDDLTGLATGGNKTRKLEFIMADALAKGADCVITAGGPQSNHCRQVAAAAARIGMKCHLVIGSAKPQDPAGNLFLDRILGAEIHWTAKENRENKMEKLATELPSSGLSPYVIPVGGSNYIGAMGYIAAVFELKEQIETASLHIDHIIFATSSGGTQAGLIVGAALANLETQLLGISIDQLPDDNDETDFQFKAHIASIANEVTKCSGLKKTFSTPDVNINYDYLGQGYGVVGDLEREAIRLLARTEGILVGPVYTGRALGGLIDLIRQEKFGTDEKILFWHTGDESALHGYVEALI